MTLQWILGWWNLIFVAPFAVALLYLGVYTLTGIGAGDADGDFEADADAHIDADADADADADLDADADVDADADADADGDAHGDSDHDAEAGGNGHSSIGAMALSWIGVGRVPLTLVTIVLLLVWGSAGFVTNALIRHREGWEAARVSLPVALGVSLVVTRAVVMFMGRFVSLNETFAKRRGELVGCVGEAMFGINDAFGMVAVRDDRGDLHQVACRVASGLEPIDKGRRVKLVAYSPQERTFFVRQFEP
jgi:membrane protein implicated in regulation of membrane protease activity